MPRLSDLLERFRRRATPPGATGHAPGPTDVRTGAESELADLFAVVDAIERDAERVRAAGHDRAEERATQAARTVAGITGRIAGETAAARATATRDRRDAGSELLAAIRRAAEEEAIATRARVDRALDDMVDTIVAAVLSAAGGDDGG